MQCVSNGIGRHATGPVLDATGTLVCLCVYRKGAEEVVQRLVEA